MLKRRVTLATIRQPISFASCTLVAALASKDVAEQSRVERQRLVEQRMQVGRGSPRRRHSRELRELIHERLQ